MKSELNRQKPIINDEEKKEWKKQCWIKYRDNNKEYLKEEVPIINSIQEISKALVGSIFQKMEKFLEIRKKTETLKSEDFSKEDN